MINSFKKIIHDFSYLPKPNIEPSFMDICHMSGDRFEERCSQILQFYFSPLAPHKLRGLFLDTLLELLNMNDIYTIQNVKVKTEESTEDRKRIDITIIADDFVIAIENKIMADVYNPLESYKRHIEKTYTHKSNKKLVLLSVKKITHSTELKRISDNGFIYINYTDLFSAIKNNIGNYMMDCNHKYLTFLFDFICTIEKKYINNNMEIKQFFFNNRKTVEELVEQYNAFKEEIFIRQCEKISEIEKLVKQKTNANWWIFQKWDLGISLNDKTNRIGIECSFRDETLENPIGDFHIYITVWKREHFTPYEAELRKAFGENIDYHSVHNRVYQHLPIIKGPIDESKIDEIVDKLVDIYTQLKDISDRIK